MNRRGQVLPVVAIGLSLLATIMMWFFNTLMYQTSGQVAMDGALRAAGVAAVHQIDEAYGYERWYIDHDAAHDLARELALEALLGDETLSAGTYSWLFGDDLAAVISSTDGTNGQANSGLDVEIINPAQEEGQDSDSSFNGVVNVGPALCGDPGTYPHAVVSDIDGECYSVATVVLRLRLDVTQLAGLTSTTERVEVSRAGTDD